MNVAKTIVNAANNENREKNNVVNSARLSKIYDNYHEISPKLFEPGKVYYYLVELYDQPISLKDFHNMKSTIRATSGKYTLQYIPNGSMKRNPKFPYLIGQDLVRIRVTVSGPKHWGALCGRIPELAWLNRNSTISRELFGIAKMHPGLVLRFGIKFVEYCDKITNRAKELGVDIDNKPLVMYQWGADSVPQVEDGDLEPIKTKEDYITVLEEVNSHINKEEDV